MAFDPYWQRWFYRHASLVLALLTIGQLAFESSSPIHCSVSVVEIDAHNWYISLLWVMPMHCLVSWWVFHIAKTHLPRSVWYIALATDLCVRCIWLHTLSQITPMPWSRQSDRWPESFGFSWPFGYHRRPCHDDTSTSFTTILDAPVVSTVAFCLVDKPFRFYLPSFLMMIHELGCLTTIAFAPIATPQQH